MKLRALAVATAMLSAQAHAAPGQFWQIQTAGDYASMCEQPAIRHGEQRSGECAAFLNGLLAGWKAAASSTECREQLGRLAPLALHDMVLADKGSGSPISGTYRRALTVAAPACVRS